MLQKTRKTWGFKKIMVYKIPPFLRGRGRGRGKPYLGTGLIFLPIRNELKFRKADSAAIKNLPHMNQMRRLKHCVLAPMTSLHDVQHTMCTSFFSFIPQGNEKNQLSILNWLLIMLFSELIIDFFSFPWGMNEKTDARHTKMWMSVFFIHT